MDNWLAPVFGKLLTSPNLADCRIIVGDKTFSCHKVILACASEYFKVQFEKEPESVEFPLKDVRFDIFENFLAYVYTYDAKKLATYSIPILVKLLEFGDRFLVPSIVKECFLCLKKKIGAMTIEELISLFELGHNLSKSELIDLVADAIQKRDQSIAYQTNLFVIMQLPETVFEEYVKIVSNVMPESMRFKMIENYISARYPSEEGLSLQLLYAEEEEQTTGKVEDVSMEKYKEPEMEIDKKKAQLNRLLDTIDYSKMKKDEFYKIVGNSCLLTYREKFEYSQQIVLPKECKICHGYYK